MPSSRHSTHHLITVACGDLLSLFHASVIARHPPGLSGNPRSSRPSAFHSAFRAQTRSCDAYAPTGVSEGRARSRASRPSSLLEAHRPHRVERAPSGGRPRAEHGEVLLRCSGRGRPAWVDGGVVPAATRAGRAVSSGWAAVARVFRGSGRTPPSRRPAAPSRALVDPLGRDDRSLLPTYSARPTAASAPTARALHRRTCRR